jgi:hypothetical protein
MGGKGLYIRDPGENASLGWAVRPGEKFFIVLLNDKELVPIDTARWIYIFGIVVRMLIWEGPPGPEPEVVVVLLISSVKYRKMELQKII